jgi:hypothetical protein
VIWPGIGTGLEIGRGVGVGVETDGTGIGIEIGVDGFVCSSVTRETISVIFTSTIPMLVRSESFCLSHFV